MSLKTELDAFRADFLARVPAEVREAMERADMELAASGILERGLKAGDKAPDFKLQGTDGKTHQLSDYVGKKAVVLAWFPKAFTGG